jgi:hypothetical protein
MVQVFDSTHQISTARYGDNQLGNDNNLLTVWFESIARLEPLSLLRFNLIEQRRVFGQ